MNSENQDIFQLIFEEHKAVMLLMEPETGSIIDANKAAVAFYKYSKEQLLNLKIQDLNIFPAEKVEFERKKALEEKKSYFIFQHRLADGQICWVEVYSSPVTFNNTKLLYSIIHDITERYKAEEALKRNEEKFTKAFISNPNGIILSEKETGRIIEVNDSFLEMTGYLKNELIGKSSLEMHLFNDPDDREKMLEYLKRDGRLRNYKLKINDRSGREYSVLVAVETLQIGERSTIITTLQDITELKQLEEKLRKEHDLLQAIFETVPAMITIYDPRISEIHTNLEFHRVTGWEDSDLRHGNIMELVYPDPGYREQVSEFMKSLQPGYRDIIMTGKDGSAIDSSWANVRLPDGRQVGIGIDIRNRKKMEQELKEKNNDLTKVNGIMEDFVHIAAHDLRGPIANLTAMSQLLEQQPTPEIKDSLFKMLAPIVEKLRNTVDGLLETVNMQTENSGIHKTLKFEDVFNNVLEELKMERLPENIMVTSDFNDAPEIIYIEAYLKSALKNLLSNAMKYSAGKKDAAVKVTSERHGEFIRLSVADNGIGINLEAAGDNLFKPFRRFTSKAQGTGMGLYILKNIIEKNGGYIEVESSPEKGTTFKCYLRPYDAPLPDSGGFPEDQ